MRQIDITFDTLGARAIPVGYQGDNLALQVAIDCSEVVADYPNAMAHIIVTDPEGEQHEDLAWMRNGTLLWQVRTVDTAIAGTGDVRVSFTDTDEDTVLKTAHAAIVVLELTDADDEIPTQLANWMAQAGITLTELRQSMVAIEQMEASTDKAADAAHAAADRLNDMDVIVTTLSAGTSATVDLTDVDGHARLTLGIPRGADGNDGANGADGRDGTDGANGTNGQDGQDGQDGADGQDGVSPSVSVTTITGGHQVSITDANGTTTFDVMDGADGEDGEDGADGNDGSNGSDGQDGVSPTVTVTEITGGHTVTITDADGDHSFNVMDGADGQDGQDGADGQDGQDGAAGADGQTGPAGPGVPSGGTTGQVLKKKSGTDYDTEWANESGGGSSAEMVVPEFTISGSSATCDMTYADVLAAVKDGTCVQALCKATTPYRLYRVSSYDNNAVTFCFRNVTGAGKILESNYITFFANGTATYSTSQTADERNLADAYSNQSTYAVGDYCIYNGKFYRCTTAISTAESWTSGHWTQVTAGDELQDKYVKPSGGIPSSDLASAVQTSLGKADSAYQKPSGGIPGTDLASGVIPTVPSASSATPQALGTAAAGSSSNYSRADHVHAKPTAADIGAIAAPGTAGTNGQVLTSNGNGGQSWQTISGLLPAVTSSDNGKFLQVSNGAWAAVTVPTAVGVSF